jgi:hypothetical protein
MTREQRLQRFAPDLLEACKEALATLLDERIDHQEAIDTLGGAIEAIERPADE